MKGFIFKFISWIGSFYSNRKEFVFNSFPDYTDNPFALYLAVKRDSYFKDYKIVWLISEKKDYQRLKSEIEIDNRTKCYLKSSIKGLWHIITCRYFICSHGLNPAIRFKTPNKLINLWHGMPLKAIGALDTKYDKRSIFDNTQIGVASNQYFADLLAKCFGVESKFILPIGQPRNDLMFSPTDFYDIYNIDRNKYDKVGTWFPTYKKNIYTENRVDGTYEPGSIGPLSLEALHRLDKDLHAIDCLLVIKIHPMDANNLVDFGLFSNIVVVKTSSPKFQTYPFLGSTDFLLTDFSSVCIDYDILKKPMGFVIEDLDSYSKSRGFIVGDLKNFLPGNFLYTYEDIVHFIKESETKYIDTGRRYNEYKDSHASERLLMHLKSKIN